MLNELNNPAFMNAAINIGSLVALTIGLGVLISLFLGAPVPALARRKR